MNKTYDVLREFADTGSGKLLGLAEKRRLGSRESVDALVHALVDIAESIEKVYGKIIPKILDEPEMASELLRERLWEIREEFRHIDYHIHDAKLMDL
jgi:hypothetical protein